MFVNSVLLGQTKLRQVLLFHWRKSTRISWSKHWFPCTRPHQYMDLTSNSGILGGAFHIEKWSVYVYIQRILEVFWRCLFTHACKVGFFSTWCFFANTPHTHGAGKVIGLFLSAAVLLHGPICGEGGSEANAVGAVDWFGWKGDNVAMAGPPSGLWYHHLHAPLLASL